ncbi:MAG: metallophosphoesterase [Candidatus Saccharimonas sp.]
MKKTILFVAAAVVAVSSFGQVAFAATGVMDDATYQITNPTTKAALTTVWTSEVTSAGANYGYTSQDTTWLSSKETGTGLSPVYRLRNNSTNDWLSEADSAKIAAAQAAGYTSQGIYYYASLTDTAATEGVYRFVKNGKHAYALSLSDRAAYTSAGYTSEGISFYAIPTAADAPEFTTPTPDPDPDPDPDPTPTTDGKFTMAIMGDTQNLSFLARNELYTNQMDTVVAKYGDQATDLRFALSTGDIISSGANAFDTTDDPGQLDRAVSAFQRLNAGSVPYTIAFGNHDTGAVCGSGSACTNSVGDGMTSVNQRLRETSVVNGRLYTSVAPEATFEPNKFENSYKTYSAEGAKWLVLSVELWPRRAALDWAKQVADSHPDYNVIVASHMIFNGDGSVSTNNGGYGNLTASTLFNELGAKPNVKMMFSGHVGTGTACATNTASFGGVSKSVFGCSTAFHGDATWNPNSDFNPVRYLTIDVNNGTVSSQIRASMKRVGSAAIMPPYEQLDSTTTGLSFIRSN